MVPLHCKAKLRPGRTKAKEKDSDLIHTPGGGGGGMSPGSVTDCCPQVS